MSNWYSEYLHKKDILSSIPNHIIESQNKGKEAEKKVRKPYFVVKLHRGQETPISALKNAREWAYSASQARFNFMRKYPYLKNYPDMGYEVECRIDMELWKQELAKIERGKQIDESKKEQVQEDLPNMWWNKY